jgi:hypothetical protein
MPPQITRARITYIFPPQRETDAPGKTIILIAIDLSLLAALLHGKTNLSFISIFVRCARAGKVFAAGAAQRADSCAQNLLALVPIIGVSGKYSPLRRRPTPRAPLRVACVNRGLARKHALLWVDSFFTRCSVAGVINNK